MGLKKRLQNECFIYIHIYIYLYEMESSLPLALVGGGIHEILLGVRVLSRMLWKLEDVKKFIMKNCKHIQK